MRAGAIVTIGLVTVIARSARADEVPRTFSLSWVRLEGAESCISTHDLGKRVEEHLNRPVLVSAAAADLSVEGRIERTVSGWTALLTISDRAGRPRGAREIRSDEPTCDKAGEEVALAVALMIDPDVGRELRPQKAPPPLPEVPRAAAERGAAPAPLQRPGPTPIEAPPEQRPRFDVRLQIGAALGLGSLPGAAIGAIARGSLRPPGFWGIQISAALWVPITAVDAPLRGARMFLAHGGASLCPVRPLGTRSSLRACAGLEAGALSAVGYGFESNKDALHFVLNAALEAQASYRIAGPFAATAGVRVAVPLPRYRIVAAGDAGPPTEIFKASPVTGSVDLGFGLEFP